MPAPDHASTDFPGFPSGIESVPAHSSASAEASGTINGVASRENFIRHSVRKWFGPNDIVDPRARVAGFAFQDALLQALFRLHRLSCNLVPEGRRLSLQETDVTAAVVVFNRLSVLLGSPLTTVVGYCEARSIREDNMLNSQLDPLQLRHLLTFHPQGDPLPDIASLKTACEQNQSEAIQDWFAAARRNHTRLPKATAQVLRELATDVWNAGSHEFMDTFAVELAVLDAAMYAQFGWENSRLYLSIFKRLQGAACREAGRYMTAAEITVAIALRKQLREADAVVHFRALSTAFDEQKFRHLESAVLSAPTETGNRLRAPSATPISRKKAVECPPAFGSPDYYAHRKLPAAS